MLNHICFNVHIEANFSIYKGEKRIYKFSRHGAYVEVERFIGNNNIIQITKANTITENCDTNQGIQKKPIIRKLVQDVEDCMEDIRLEWYIDCPCDCINQEILKRLEKRKMDIYTVRGLLENLCFLGNIEWGL